jgi:tetratricopeptide (TPR) repeat protein
MSTATSLESLIEDGVRLSRNGDATSALERFRDAIALEPRAAEGYFNLGIALRNLNRLDDAIAAFEHAVSLRPTWPEARFNLANAFRDANRREPAIATFRAAVELRPTYTKALNNLGNLLFDRDELDEAEQTFQKALAVKPDYPEALYNLGRVYKRQRKLGPALQSTSKAAALRPENTRYQISVAELQRNTGNRAAATQTLKQLVEADPACAEAVVELARMLKDRGQVDEAIGYLSKAAAHGCQDVDLLWLKADLLRAKRRYQEALADINQAAALEPDSHMVHNLRSMILLVAEQHEEAVAASEVAIGLRPSYAEAHNNRGAALQVLRRFDESNAAFAKTLRLSPACAPARLNNAISLLRDGKFEEGWREFEWRFLTPDLRMPPLNIPVWAGESLEGKTILLRTEQGIGDTFQFVRYAKLVKDCGGRVVVQCQDAAVDLVSRSEFVDQVVGRKESLDKIDVQLPLMSLPAVFGTTLNTVPSQVPYLSANPSLIDCWRKRLRALGKVIVAIGWQGNRNFGADHLRSLKLANFKALSEIPGVALVSLQKNEGVEQLREIDFAVHDFSTELDNTIPFTDTAAIMASCDLVVTSDTAIAHLAGALARPTWVALGYSPDWRWLTSGETSPWYPTMRLFRQPELYDWKSVFRSMADELALAAAGDKDRLLPPSRPVKPAIEVPVSAGELFDKITILEIKRREIADAAARQHVERELDDLERRRPSGWRENPRVQELIAGLADVNEQLWKIEDAIRECEREQRFDQQFVELARSVYQTNDRRSNIKRQINRLFDSAIVEVKSYADYSASAVATTCRETYSPLARFDPGNAQSLESYLRSAGEIVVQATSRHPLASRSLEVAKQQGRPRAGIVIGHFDSPDFVQLGLALIRKHCGDVPVLIADDCSPGFGEQPQGGFKQLLAIAKTDGTARVWSSQQRFGHVAGDLSALAKGLIWASQLKLNFLVKLSQRLIIDRQGWLEEAIQAMIDSDAACLARGCTDFGWRIRTEAMVLNVPAWNRDSIFRSLLSPPEQQFAEWIVETIVNQHFAGRQCDWSLLAPGRHERAEGVFFRATHSSSDYAALARSIGLNEGIYCCTASEDQTNYKP